VGSDRPFLLGPGEGRAFWSLGGRFVTKVGGPTGEGRITLIEILATRAAEPPVHIHHREDESWYVIDGQLSFHVAGEVLVATSGSFVFAPRGIAHAFTVDIEPTRLLIVAAPAGFERFMEEAGVPATGDEPPPGLQMPGPETLGPIAQRYGIEIVGPPIRDAG
jgi:quercetin dioxygenase-like cupin family protein